MLLARARQVSTAVVCLGRPANTKEATVSGTAGVRVLLCAELITAKAFTLLLTLGTVDGLTAASTLMRKVGNFTFLVSHHPSL